MTDEWDQLAQEITEQKAAEPEKKKYRDPSVKAITDELHDWWAGIEFGQIKFIPGLPLLAGYVPAYVPGHMLVVSGYTSAGKSQLLSQIVEWCAGTQKANTLVFSNEDSRMEKMISLVSVMSVDIHRKKMLLGNICAQEKERAYDIFTNILQWPLKIYDDVAMLSAMEEIIKSTAPKIVVLDYIQNVIAPGHSIYERMMNAAQNVFRMAQQYGITFIVASQVSNESIQNDSDVISLKGAGELAASAHTVIQLRKGRKEADRHKVLIQVKKNKAFGNCGDLECRFNEHWTRIEEDIVGVYGGR
jgi:predicted ATP-dependent serine protease